MSARPDPRARARLTFIVCAAAAFSMLGLAFASKPLYNTFCRVTGYGGTTQRAEAAAQEVLDRAVTIRFDTNVAGGLPLIFKAEEVSRTIEVGENALAFFTITNTSDRPAPAVATYNVTPYKAGPYFTKLQCFCFSEQVFQPGETVEMPVVFYVDPRIDDERRLKDVDTITLSYTFFPAEGDGNGDGGAATRPAAEG